MSKPRVAFFDFASCEGCQLALLNCEDQLLDLLEQIDLVEFREAMSEKSTHYDIAFIEGSIHREEDVNRLRDIRSRSTYLVALGACACNGNVQARSNFVAPAQNFAAIYGSEARDRVQTDPRYWPLWAHTRVRTVDELVKVDFSLRGCPMQPEEFLHLVKSLLHGSYPHFSKNSVCVECKKNGNECNFDRGIACMGPITWGGCKAICINAGHRCDGCRGLLPDANIEAHQQLLEGIGINDTEMLNRYRLHCSRETIGDLFEK